MSRVQDATPNGRGDVAIELPTSRDALKTPAEAPADSPGFCGIRFKMPIHLIIFFVLTFLHAAALLVFKLSLVDGAYPFSSASVLSTTELFKLFLATNLHRREIANMSAATRPDGIVDSFRKTATPGLWFAVFVIAAMYTANNLLTFFCLARVDPGTLAIAKALVPYVTAVALQIFGRSVNGLQWACIVLQCVGVATTQYKGGASHGPAAAGLNTTAAEGEGLTYSVEMYMFLALSIVITTLSSVWNERIIKRYKAPLQQINMIMYFCGTILAFILYCAVPDYHEKGFFEGYTLMAFVVIFVQGTYGLSVGYAYKYADVLIKNLSTSATLAVLVGLSAMFFGKPLTFHSTTGSVVIICTSYIYMIHAHKSAVDGEACASVRRAIRLLRFTPLGDEDGGSQDTSTARRNLILSIVAFFVVGVAAMVLLSSLVFQAPHSQASA